MAKKKENDNVVNNEVMEHNDTFAAEQVDVTAFAQRSGIVNCDNLRLRKAPSLDGDVIKLLPKGTEVIIIENANESFYKISDGYVMKKFVDEK